MVKSFSIKNLLAASVIFIILILLLSLFACNDKKPVSNVESEEKIEIAEGASFEIVKNIGVDGSAFYLYSPSAPHDFFMLSGFLNSVIFVYPNEPLADEKEALKELNDLGLLALAETTPAYIIMPMPLNGRSWTKADLDSSTMLSQTRLASMLSLASLTALLRPFWTSTI